MKRIMIVGRAGAGKSHLAAVLGKKLGIPVFHLDKLYWLPGWVGRTKPDLAIDVERILAAHDSWVIDGNYKRSAFESRVRLADIVIMLDFGFLTCAFRALKRRMIHHKKTRPDMGEGCMEKIDLEFLGFIWGYKKRTRAPIEDALSRFPEKTVLRFRNQRQVDRWLRTL